MDTFSLKLRISAFDSDSEEENDVPGADDIDPSTVYKSGLRRLVGRWRNPKLMEEFLRTQTVTRYPSDGRRYRRADTNILSMKCDKLLSCTLTLRRLYTIWTCEFCGTENQVRLENEELPRYAYDDLSFLLEPAVSDTVSIETDDTLVIFCIDISGSMCVTTPYLPGEDKDVTYVSRLQAAQAAIDQQLEDMSRKHPNRRVALVTFNSQDRKCIPLEEGTVTALGPALTVAVSIASQRPRSKVIICTDGRANSGLGKLDELNTDEDEENARKFYKDVGTHALKKGVAISVNMVDPQTLPKEFSNILAEPVIATNVTVTLVLPNKLIVVVVVVEAHVIKPISAFEVKLGSSDTSSEQLPFQLQVHYKALNGAKILRVFTEKRPVTRDRKLAERRINLDILGKHTANVTAQLAMDGKYTRCRSIALMNQRLASRYTNTLCCNECINKKFCIEKKERLKLGHTYSDDEDEVGVLQSLLPDTKTKITTKINKRTSECNDETATLIYQ
ncbi:hypothetical protein KUTeg_011382, partial [Tegillarca granosa]